MTRSPSPSPLSFPRHRDRVPLVVVVVVANVLVVRCCVLTAKRRGEERRGAAAHANDKIDERQSQDVHKQNIVRSILPSKFFYFLSERDAARFILNVRPLLLHHLLLPPRARFVIPTSPYSPLRLARSPPLSAMRSTSVCVVRLLKRPNHANARNRLFLRHANCRDGRQLITDDW